MASALDSWSRATRSSAPSEDDASAVLAYLSSSGNPIGLATAIVRAAAEQRPRPLQRGSGKRMVAGSSLETCLSAMKAARETHVASVGNAVRRCSFEQNGSPMKCIFTPRCSTTRKAQNQAHTSTPMRCCLGFISPTICRVNEAIRIWLQEKSQYLQKSLQTSVKMTLRDAYKG
jgi:hypothetical protein